jgi:hypothetical protein
VTPALPPGCGTDRAQCHGGTNPLSEPAAPGPQPVLTALGAMAIRIRCQFPTVAGYGRSAGGTEAGSIPIP